MADPWGGSLAGFAPDAWGVGGSAKPVARIGDSGSHGGTLVTGSPTTKADGGRPVCRIGDTYACPVHGPNPISTGSAIFKDNGPRLARLGDSTACGATITSGSPTWKSA